MIDFEELQSVKIRIERSLPPDVVETLRRTDMQLTLGSSSHARPAAPPARAGAQAFQPVVIDQKITDELAEMELLEEMTSYRKDATGIDNTIFISPKGQVRHAPRIKLAIDPPDSINPRAKTASIAIHDGSVIAGESVPAPLLRQVQQFIEINRDALLDYWDYRIDTRQLDRLLKSICDRTAQTR